MATMTIHDLLGPRTVTYTARREKLEELLAAMGGLQALIDLIDAERETGRSWRSIAQGITDDTGIPVSYESLRRWHGIATSKSDER